MNLRLTDESLTLFRSAEKGVLLGIIMSDGEVRLTAADRVHVPGHADWIRRDRIVDAFRGFSVGVVQGKMRSMSLRSTVNPSEADFVLEPDLAAQVESLLARTDDYESIPE